MSIFTKIHSQRAKLATNILVRNLKCDVELDQTPPPPGVRLVLISDTHSRHNGLEAILPQGDVVIHAGDFCNTGTIAEVESFTEWFDSLPFNHRVFIAGNHDTSLDKPYYVDRGHARFHSFGKSKKTPEDISDHCIGLVRNSSSVYLQDENTVIDVKKTSQEMEDEYFPLRVYGSPWSPEFCDWAFNLNRGEDCREKWNLVPEDIDVLITHGPPYGYGDETTSGFRCGCEDLLQNIRSREVCPRVHIFGHIHEDRGAWHDGKTLFVNASTCTFNYKPTNAPIVVNLPYDTSLPATIVHTPNAEA